MNESIAGETGDLSAADGEENSQVVRLLESYLERLERDGRADPQEFLAAHPELGSQLQPYLEELTRLHEAAANLRGEGFPLPGKGEDAAGRGGDRSRPAPEWQPQGGTLGDYRLVREVGRGGMGVVYEAEQISLRRRVALKVLPYAAVLDKRALARFKNEALAAAQLDHPNIVSLYGIGCERSVHFYAMRFIDGPTLADCIRQMQERQRQSADLRFSSLADLVADSAIPLHQAASDHPAGGAHRLEAGADPTTAYTPAAPGATAVSAVRDSASASSVRTGGTPPARRDADTAPDAAAAAAASTRRSFHTPAFFRSVADLAAQVADALDHAHEQGVIHRDIKPSNLILDQQGRPYVADFGLARIGADAALTMTGDLLGTLRYMSPEQALARRVGVDHRTDIYSLGITLYELLALRPAFPSDSREELLRQIAADEPPALRKLNRAIPADLETVVHKAISKDPADRYATAADLAADLRRYTADRPVEARRPGAVKRLGRWGRRHRGIVATAVVVSILGLAVGGGAMLHEQAKTSSALETAREQRIRADANLEAAQEVLETLVGRTKEDPLLRGPRMERLRRDFLEEALRFNQRLVDDNPLDPAARAAAAQTYRRLGILHHSLGQFDRSIAAHRTSRAEYENVLRELDDPEHLDGLCSTLNSLSLSLADSGDYKEAESVLSEALDVSKRLTANHPTVATYRESAAKLRNTRGRLLALQDRHAEAERDYRAAVDLAPRVARYQANLGACFAQQGRYDEAERPLRRAIDLSASADASERARHKAELAIALWELHQDEEAERVCREALSEFKGLATEHPDVPDYRHSVEIYSANLAGRLHAAGRLAEAAEWYETAMQHGLWLAEQFPDAPVFADEFPTICANYAQLLKSMRAADPSAESEALLRQRIEDWRRAVESSPQNAPLRDALASICDALGSSLPPERFEEADSLLEEAVAQFATLAERHPTEPRYQGMWGAALSNSAIVQRRTGRLVEARSLIAEAIQRQSEALKLSPGHPMYSQFLRNHFAVLADISLALADHAAAAEAAEAALRLLSDKPAEHVRTAVRLFRCGRLARLDPRLTHEERRAIAGRYSARAEALLARGLDLDPDRLVALSRAAWFLAAPADCDRDQASLAVQFALEAARLDPESADIANTLGVAHYRAGEWSSAVVELTRSCAQGDGGNAADFFFLAMAHCRLRECELARARLAEGLAWLDSHAAAGDPDLRSFRDEAEALLAATTRSLPTREDLPPGLPVESSGLRP